MEPKLKLEYKIDKEDWLLGFDLYYKLFKRNTAYIRAIIFAIPLVLFIEQVIKDPTFTVGWVCIGVCCAMIAIALLGKKTERKNMATAVEAIQNDRYILSLFDDRLTVKTEICEDPANLEYDENGEVKPLPEIPESVCEFDDKILKVYETERLVALFSRRASFFVPKKEIEPNDLEVLVNSLKQAVGNKYFNK